MADEYVVCHDRKLVDIRILFSLSRSAASSARQPSTWLFEVSGFSYFLADQTYENILWQETARALESDVKFLGPPYLLIGVGHGRESRVYRSGQTMAIRKTKAILGMKRHGTSTRRPSTHKVYLGV